MERKSKTTHLSDDVCIIMLAGIQRVSKSDAFRSHETVPTAHRLVVSRKGVEHSFDYSDAGDEARDKMYGRLRDALCPDAAKAALETDDAIQHTEP